MLAAIIRKLLHDEEIERIRCGLTYAAEFVRDIVVESAGTYVDVGTDCRGKPAHPYCVAAMAKRKIDVRNHKSKPTIDVKLDKFNLIVCVSEAEKEFVANLRPHVRSAIILVNAAEGGIPDPYGKGQEVFDECATALEVEAQAILKTFFGKK